MLGSSEIVIADATIDYFLQFYDPTAKADIMLDYVRIRFRTTDAIRVIEEIMRIKTKYMLFDSHALYGCEGQYYFAFSEKRLGAVSCDGRK